MAVPLEILNLSKQYIAAKVIPLLTPEIEAVCIEIISWHIKVHTYQHAIFSGQSWEDLDAVVDELTLALPAREGEPWQSTLASHRSELGEPLRYEGQVVFER